MGAGAGVAAKVATTKTVTASRVATKAVVRTAAKETVKNATLGIHLKWRALWLNI